MTYSGAATGLNIVGPDDEGEISQSGTNYTINASFTAAGTYSGTITTISSSSTTAIATDTTGAQLRQTSDGSLFIKDGDSTFQMTSPDGGYVDLTFEETFSGGSFKSEAIAVQKVGSDYKLAIKETSTFGSDTDISYIAH